ncbi:MAG TPA: EcsC family protein [Pseudogracilibacillus sp.]|nr:EcsC family protein [Pseudogracilibacillus sp.]
MDQLTRDEMLIEKLEKWKKSLYTYELSKVEKLYEKWIDQLFSIIPETVVEELFEKIDAGLFETNSFILSMQMQQEAEERILLAAQAMNQHVRNLSDLKMVPTEQLTHLAEQQAAKHRVYSMLQGGVTGTGNRLMVTSDFLSSVVINLRAIQLIALSFGNDIHSKSGMIETLKVFNTALMPNRLKIFGWEDLMFDLDEEYDDEMPRIIDQTSIDEPIKQLLKISLIMALTKNRKSSIPLLSIAIGSGMNYCTTRNITKFAINYYQYKHLHEKQ